MRYLKDLKDAIFEDRAGLSERGALARFRCHSERAARAYKGSGAEPAAGVQGTQPPAESQGGFAP